MSPLGVNLLRCSTCGARYYPGRLLCAACGGAKLRPQPTSNARVDEVTTLRATPGIGGTPHQLATVRTKDGVRLVVRLLDESGPGDEVILSEEGGALLARRAQ